MNFPAQLKYAKSHEWVKMGEDKTAKIGITDFAQQELGDLVFVDLPEVGDTVSVGEPFADVESVKAVSSVYSPVTGVVSAINEELLDNPARINEAPYDAWLICVSDISETEEMLDAAAYEAFCETEGA